MCYLWGFILTLTLVCAPGGWTLAGLSEVGPILIVQMGLDDRMTLYQTLFTVFSVGGLATGAMTSASFPKYGPRKVILYS